MELKETIERRKSIRAFRREAVPREVLRERKKVDSAGRRASNGGAT